MADVQKEQHSMLNTTFPVLLPDMPELRMSKPDFEAYIKASLSHLCHADKTADSFNIPVQARDVAKMKSTDKDVDVKTAPETSAFMDGLLSDKRSVPTLDERDDKMRTENADVAFRTSGEALVDAFFELEDVVSGDRLRQLLDKAWDADPDATLKIIWNARSIHLGKSSRNTFYRAVGWLAEKHPVTLLVNLPWLVRPLIQKKAPKPADKKDGKEQKDGLAQKAESEVKSEDAEMIEADDADSDFEMIDEKPDHQEGEPPAKKVKLDEDTQVSEFDVKFGVAHGYWKDLLNILALAANDELKADGKPRSILNVERPKDKKRLRDWTEGRKKAQTSDRHDRVVQKLQDDAFYKALHLTVARLFADQLKLDLARSASGSRAEMKRITLAAKWAPSHKGMHDQHTCIVSTISELLYTFDNVCSSSTTDSVDPGDRETYLKHARQAYQLKTLSPLRKALEVVERPIAANKFDEINYERVPSLAMKQYTTLFAKKDFERFDGYIDTVASGKAKISGATLLPSALVKAVSRRASILTVLKATKVTNALVEKKLQEMQAKALDGQWSALVQRIKDSGMLASSIAVCDVSGSMGGPTFPDGTCPMDSAIGLSLLVAEVTAPPFGGTFITFSASPQVMRAGGADDKRSLKDKVAYIERSNWSMNTNFVAVFERLILPMAVENKLTRDEMVKQVFVFSDMQFDSAQSSYDHPGGPRDDWSTSYERIQKKFEEAGYLMPKLVFWNLAGGRAGYDSDSKGGDDTAPKPVTAADEGTALVSGYSQGQMKMFLDNGQFTEPEDEIVEEEAEDGVVVKKEKAKDDPLATVRKALSHEAYRMLKVVD